MEIKKINIWEEYQKLERLSTSMHCPVTDIYKTKNRNTGKYYNILEIPIDGENKKNIIKLKKFIDTLNLKNFNKIIEIIEHENYINHIYIIEEFSWNYSIEELMKGNKKFSIEEIQIILNQINSIIKYCWLNNIQIYKIYPYLIYFDYWMVKLSSIALLNDYQLFQNDDDDNICLKELLFKSPEELRGDNINQKSFIWSLGVFIYYLLFQEFPYNQRKEILLYKDMMYGKNLKTCSNDYLNSLIKKMLEVNVNKRISLEQYLENDFFKNNLLLQNVSFLNYNPNIIDIEILKLGYETKFENYKKELIEKERKIQELEKEIENKNKELIKSKNQCEEINKNYIKLIDKFKKNK